ncbi:hypothetical protein Tco_0689824 [Tanacetum coccineum]
MNNVHSNIAPPLMASVTGIGMNATSQRQSENQSHRSASNYTKIPTHAILTSRTAMILFGMAKRQSQMSASNMQQPTQLVLSAVMDAVSEGPSQTYVSNHMQFQQHNLNSMRNDQSGRSASNSMYDVKSTEDNGGGSADGHMMLAKGQQRTLNPM